MTLDDPGTYLIEVGTGKTVKVGEQRPGRLVAGQQERRRLRDRERVADAAPPDRAGAGRSPDARHDRREQGEINHLRWSPDGSQLAFTLTRMGRDPGPALMVADPASGAAKQLVRGSIGEIAWTRDSKGITAITLEEGGGSIVTFDAANGEVREIVPDIKDANCLRGLAWSPDGSYLAFGGPGFREGCGDAGNWGVWTWHPSSKTVRQLFRGPADAPQWLATGAVVAMTSESESDGVPPLSIGRLSPDGAASGPVAFDIPRMFPQPSRLFQVVGNSVMFPISTCEQGEAHLWTVGQRESARFTPEIVYAYSPVLSPDAKTLAYVTIGEQSLLLLAPVPQGADEGAGEHHGRAPGRHARPVGRRRRLVAGWPVDRGGGHERAVQGLRRIAERLTA